MEGRLTVKNGNIGGAANDKVGTYLITSPHRAAIPDTSRTGNITIVNADGSTVRSASAATLIKTVSASYYDLMGKKCAPTAKGILIKETKTENGVIHQKSDCALKDCS